MKNEPEFSLSRRKFAGVALATSALALIPSTRAESAKPSNAKSPAGLLTTSLGSYSITSLLDGTIPLERKYFSGDDKAIDSILSDIGLTEGVIPSPINAFILKSEEKTILVDAGMGAISALGEGYGHMLAGLLSAGVTPEQVDMVVLTHAHPDHMGGLLTADGKAVFPNAELIIAEPEVKFWNDPGMLSQAPDAFKWIFEFAQKAIAAYGDQVTQVASGKEIAKGIIIEAAPGHTPGHSILKIDGGSKQLALIADLVHSTELYTAIPDIGFGFDTDSKLAGETRKKLFDQLSADKSLIAGSHVHFPGFGRFLKDDNGYRFIPATVQWIRQFHEASFVKLRIDQC